jgi:hypothetical protein
LEENLHALFTNRYNRLSNGSNSQGSPFNLRNKFVGGFDWCIIRLFDNELGKVEIAWIREISDGYCYCHRTESRVYY